MPVPSGVVIRRAGPWDVPAMAKVYVDAYGVPGDSQGFADVYRVSLEVEPGGCLVAEYSGRIVGTACYYVYGNMAWVGAVGVVRSMQRRGIGRALMERVLEELRSRGVVETVRLDSTEAGFRLYKSLGFKPDYETVMYELTRPPKCPGRVRVVESSGIPAEALSLDREALGADRSKALKPFMERGVRVLVEGSRRVEGYANTRAGRVQ